ncbi:50S ribosomal protein L21 [Spiroplasma helicoides]|uniref:Large ribosomal subunit protein bL21 n=1 Tax=Spiroplasma helicoides TaxID=216938 RepID=A0A1B3SJS8_9MOLU|nr:50S ribosomal protein L21 [Spiroplasma helicoides]
MFAIIKTGGKQLMVKPGDEIYIEKLTAEEGQKVTFEEVLATESVVGTPYVQGVVITGTVVKHGKEEKLRVVRYHPKKNVNKVYGHRQPYTKVKIDDFSAGAISTKTAAAKPAEPKTAAPKPAAKPAEPKTAAPKPKATPKKPEEK